MIGLAVNVVSAWLLSGSDHHHGHSHGNADDEHRHDEAHHITTNAGVVVLEIFEDGSPPRFRLHAETGPALSRQAVAIETVRPDGVRQRFAMNERGGYLESLDEVPEPHEFKAHVKIGPQDYSVTFEEHEHAHGSAYRDNNMRAAVVHVIADAAVSVFVIVGLLLARTFGWLWMDPLAGIAGAFVIASWSYGLIRDTGAILLDMNPDRRMAERLRATIETDGDHVTDLHLWRLGPGHFGAILSIATAKKRGSEYYRRLIDQFRTLSHTTIEVQNLPPIAGKS